MLCQGRLFSAVGMSLRLAKEQRTGRSKSSSTATTRGIGSGVRGRVQIPKTKGEDRENEESPLLFPFFLRSLFLEFGMGGSHKIDQGGDKMSGGDEIGTGTILALVVFFSCEGMVSER